MGSGERKRYIYEEEVRMEIRMMKVKTMVCCVLMMVLALLAGNQSTLGGVKSVAAQESIASVASGVDDLSILVEAVVAAGLLDAVADPAAAFTVFAPTNEAFVSLLGALGLDGLGDIPVDLLTDVLLYHVVPAVAFSTDLSNGQILPTLNGAELVVDLSDGVVIDAVLLPFSTEAEEPVEEPSPESSIASVASGVEDLSILVEAVVAAGLLDAVADPEA